MKEMGVPFLVLAVIAAVFALALWYARRASRLDRIERADQEVRVARDPGSLRTSDANQANSAERAVAASPVKQPSEDPAPVPASIGPAVAAVSEDERPDTEPGWIESAAPAKRSPVLAFTGGITGANAIPAAGAPVVAPAIEPRETQAEPFSDDQSSAGPVPLAKASPIKAPDHATLGENAPAAVQAQHRGRVPGRADETPLNEAQAAIPEEVHAAMQLPEAQTISPSGPLAKPPSFEAEIDVVTVAKDSAAAPPFEDSQPCSPAAYDLDSVPIAVAGPAERAGAGAVSAEQHAANGVEAVSLASDPETGRYEPGVDPDPQQRPATEASVTADGVADNAVHAAESHTRDDGNAVQEVASEELPAAESDDLLETRTDDPANLTQAVEAAAAMRQPVRPAVHRDRRGRQATAQQPAAEAKRARRQTNTRPAAEARLRLSLHSIRRTAQLALVLMRPEEFPPQVTLELDGSQTTDALGEGQYGDIDLLWGTDLLSGEIRVSCAEGFQWVRSARPVHIFAADPAQADLVTVASAAAGVEHTIICREQDASAVSDVAESAGSARPVALQRFTGIAAGWAVLTGYRPTRAASSTPLQEFLPLDPGNAIAITLQGGLEVGRRSYAQGRPPRIRIEPALDGVTVRIGGAEGVACGDGSWEAPGWDLPGPHLIDIVPGPTLKYEILEDPAVQSGWPFWNAHGNRTASDEGPWSRAGICGAQLSGPLGELVIAAEMQPTILALGIDGSVGTLRPRAGLGVSVGFAGGTPAFLLTSSGRRRSQGKVVWLGLAETVEAVLQPRRLSPLWVDAVRSAAARRLAMQADEEGAGQSIWRKAILLARSIKRQRHE